MNETDRPHGASRDAEMIALAIYNQWFRRGFYFGIGFWLAGVVAMLITAFFILLMLGSAGV
jgi:hypothetical protein